MKTIKILIVMMFMAMPAFSQTGMPSITVTEAEKDFTLPIKRAKVDVKIVGSLAITTFDIHFYNPNKRTLEGQLDFPLAEGVIVSRFAMDVNKKLREGVIVAKDKGRVTYEEIVNRRVDPGLLEVTRGNNFRSRVYPLFPEKEKHIVIAYEEELKVTPDGLKYSLPLNMPNELDEFSFKATVYSDFAKPINNSTNGSKFRHKDDSYTLLAEYTDYKAKELYEFIIPYFGEESVQLETYNNEDFFRISLNPDMMLQAKEKPQTISILWDISASRLNSDIKKDLELLEEYLEYNQCNVELVPFSLYADEPSYFPNADFHELKANINGLRIDGATNYSSVDISKLRGDEIFIFSDGIDNIGEGGFGETEKPMYVINSSSISDHDVCRKLAQKTGGKYINLIDENTESALNLLNYNFPYFMGIDGIATEVYPKNEIVKGNINITGKLQASAQLTLKFGYGNKVTKTIPINITEANRTKSGILHKIWAKQKLADLNLNQTENEKEITDLAKKYSLVTAFTSLIVLETAWDYVKYKIEPPEELRAEYDNIMSQSGSYQNVSGRNNNNEVYIKNLVSQTIKEYKDWYSYDYEKKQYIDSVFKELDHVVSEILNDLDPTNDSKAYYVIDLKKYLPEIDFESIGAFYSKIISPRQSVQYHTRSLFGYLSTIRVNGSEFVQKQVYPFNLSSGSSEIQPKYFGTYYFDVESVDKVEFEFLTRKLFKDAFDDNLLKNKNINLKDYSISISIQKEDLDDYKNKLYVVKDPEYFLSKKKLDSIFEADRIEASKHNKGYVTFSSPGITSSNNNMGYGALKGVVTDFNNRPLPGVTVRVLGTKKGAKSKANGSFIINNLTAGTYQLKASYVGKADVESSPFEIQASVLTSCKIVMVDKVSSSGCVVIANKEMAYGSEELTTSERLERIANENLVDVIAMKAGVENSGSGFSIRGTRQADTQILVEGMDLSNKFTGGMGIGGSKYYPNSNRSTTTAQSSANAEVSTTEYQSSKEYFKELNSAAIGELEDTYFELKEDNILNPSFYVDAAQVFKKQGKIKEACRVISNLAEINLEDHENLRRVAGFLMENKEYQLAKSIYKHILKIRNEEPQTYRDYALCLAQLGEYQAAADSLYNIFTGNIPRQFEGIRSTVFSEFNTLILEHADEIDISKYDPGYLFETPVDLRIEITWVMDETDIDLWVIEPDETLCKFNHRYTKNGGFLSKDMTQGYGPEVYMMRKATEGKYKIKAKFYSNSRQRSNISPEVRCKIYTNYGKPDQKVQEILRKIEIQSGVIEIGEIAIK